MSDTRRRYETERLARLRRRTRESPARKRLVAELVRREAQISAAESGEAAPTWSQPLPPSRWQRYRVWSAERRKRRDDLDDRDRRDRRGDDDFFEDALMAVGRLLVLLLGLIVAVGAAILAAPAIGLYRFIHDRFVDQDVRRGWPVRTVGTAGIVATGVAVAVVWVWTTQARAAVDAGQSAPPSWWPVPLLLVLVAAALLGSAGYAIAAGWPVRPFERSAWAEDRAAVSALPPSRLTSGHRAVLDLVARYPAIRPAIVAVLPWVPAAERRYRRTVHTPPEAGESSDLF